MINEMPALIAYISTILPLTPGDVCEVEISGIGILRNPVAAEAA